jgi:hypothetical protein
MMLDGLSQSEIARKLKISRQAVHKCEATIHERIAEALNDAAKLNRVEPRHLDTSKGILWGWSREFETETVIALDPQEGLRVWYQHSLGKCKICPDKRRCRSILLKHAASLGVSLTRNEENSDPIELSKVVFYRVLGLDKKQ